MNKIRFFNHYHNGDLFCSKAFIRHIMDELKDFEFTYHHNNNPKTISDLISYGGMANDSVQQRFILNDRTLAINTWIGIYIEDRYPEPPYFWNGGINYVALHNIWNYIFENINKVFGTNLKIKSSPKDYISTIDFTKFDTSNVDSFLNTRGYRRKILISNGRPMSGQSFVDDLSIMIIPLAKHYSNYDFYCTNRFHNSESNIFFTSDITKLDSDLNEISWLSRSCDLIVGKNSGPFIYCLERENFTNPKKKFLSFNNSKVDSLDYGIDIECDYTCSTSVDGQEIFNLIHGKIKEL